MDAATQQNAALVEQASAAAQALMEQAANLSKLISRYQVGGGSTGGAQPRAVATERRAETRPWSGKTAAAAPTASAPARQAAGAGAGAQWTDF